MRNRLHKTQVFQDEVETVELSKLVGSLFEKTSAQNLSEGEHKYLGPESLRTLLICDQRCTHGSSDGSSVS